TLGRWVQQDRHFDGPYVDGMNAYQYVGSNPATLLDPTGLSGGAIPSNLSPEKVPATISKCEIAVRRNGNHYGIVMIADGKRYSIDGTGPFVNGIKVKVGNWVLPGE